MSGPINLAQVAGKHVAIYEAYYKQANPKGYQSIGAMEAAKFLKKTALSDVVLSRIWDLSDPRGRGHLDKTGFYTALKLVSLAQAGKDINIDNIYLDTQNPPKVGDIPKIPPQVPPPAASMLHDESTEWAMSAADEAKYKKTFNSLRPEGGLLQGNKVKGVLMESKLPVETLGKIWDLADQDKDGNLDVFEFSVVSANPNTLSGKLDKHPAEKVRRNLSDRVREIKESESGLQVIVSVDILLGDSLNL